MKNINKRHHTRTFKLIWDNDEKSYLKEYEEYQEAEEKLDHYTYWDTINIRKQMQIPIKVGDILLAAKTKSRKMRNKKRKEQIMKTTKESFNLIDPDFRTPVPPKKNESHGVLIGPEFAEQLLQRGVIKKRPLSYVFIKRYANDMAAGKWDFNGEPIIIGKSRKNIRWATQIKCYYIKWSDD